MSRAERDDMQGLAAFSYGKLTEARYILARIKDAAAARAWCRDAPVSNACELPDAPDVAMHLAFTAAGLRALGVADSTLNGFSTEFCDGMIGSANRSRRLGDIGANDPSTWYWGGPKTVPHIVVLLYARESRLESWQSSVLSGLWEQAFDGFHYLDTSDMGDAEPFGFRDGISQPVVDWDLTRDPAGDTTDYGNIVSLGEFILGYPNEYGKYTDRPVLARADDPDNDLPAAEDSPDRRDLGRNGTYLVLRHLEQDVRGFWQFIDRTAKGDGREREALAQSMVGRARNGEPLISRRTDGIPGIGKDPQNGFVYDSDTSGIECPFGAHIRRANPRNADLPGHPGGLLSKTLKRLALPRPPYGADLIASTRFHRILRRGREYGEKLNPEDALRPRPTNEAPRGLHFACVNGHISRQFEFVQSAWLMSPKFDGMEDEADPLMGNREPFGGCAVTDAFSIPRPDGAAARIAGLPRFITVRGGAYFFMPGLRALRWLTRGNYRKS